MFEIIKQNLFPTMLLIIDILAGIEKFNQGDYKKTIYWLAAALLTYTVTF